MGEWKIDIDHAKSLILGSVFVVCSLLLIAVSFVSMLEIRESVQLLPEKMKQFCSQCSVSLVVARAETGYTFTAGAFRFLDI